MYRGTFVYVSLEVSWPTPMGKGGKRIEVVVLVVLIMYCNTSAAMY